MTTLKKADLERVNAELTADLAKADATITELLARLEAAKTHFRAQRAEIGALTQKLREQIYRGNRLKNRVVQHDVDAQAAAARH